MRACRVIAAAPSSSAIRPASVNVTWVSSIPMRSLTVTGTDPAASMAEATMARKRARWAGNAAPAPWRVTLPAGHPKLRSMWSTPISSTSRPTAARMTCGSTPDSWMLRTGSSSPNAAMVRVLALPSTRARAEIISLTVSPAP